MSENLGAIILYLLWAVVGGYFLFALFRNKKSVGLPSFEAKLGGALLFICLLVLSAFFAGNLSLFIQNNFSINSEYMTFTAPFLQNIFWMLSACVFLFTSETRVGLFSAKFGEGLKIFFKGIFYLLMFYPFLNGISLLWEETLQAFGIDIEQQTVVLMFKEIDNVYAKIIAIFSVAILAPISEELVFRACLGGSLKYYFGKYVSAFMVAAIFAFVHYNLYVSVPIFAFSLFLSYLYGKFGDLRINIAGHFAFNSINILALIL